LIVLDEAMKTRQRTTLVNMTFDISDYHAHPRRSKKSTSYQQDNMPGRALKRGHGGFTITRSPLKFPLPSLLQEVSHMAPS
jgi:hypothetical protein